MLLHRVNLAEHILARFHPPTGTPHEAVGVAARPIDAPLGRNGRRDEVGHREADIVRPHVERLPHNLLVQKHFGDAVVGHDHRGEPEDPADVVPILAVDAVQEVLGQHLRVPHGQPLRQPILRHLGDPRGEKGHSELRYTHKCSLRATLNDKHWAPGRMTKGKYTRKARGTVLARQRLWGSRTTHMCWLRHWGSGTPPPPRPSGFAKRHDPTHPDVTNQMPTTGPRQPMESPRTLAQY